MRNYMIDSLPYSKDMTNIVAKFEKSRKNWLLMGMYMPGDTFQAKVYDIIGEIEGIDRYIDDILVLSKDKFPKYIDHISVIFSRLYHTT